MITTDICIAGAEPVGLFAEFGAGLLRCAHLIDVLPQAGCRAPLNMFILI